MNRTLLATVLLAFLFGAVYLGTALQAGEGVAFPLDDSWIHQTYARNLAQSGQWAYVAGQPSAGSTAPLWTLALAGGYLLGFDGVWWSHLLGLALLAALSLAAAHLARALYPAARHLPVAVALFCAAEWHLDWAAVSGMETLLFTLLQLLLLAAAVAAAGGARRALALGVLGGLLTLTRPEGSVLFALCAAALALSHVRARRWTRALGEGMLAALPFAVLVAPVIWFNYRANGTPFPNTFSAKQQEYALLLARPYLLRLAELAGTLLIGPLALLVPGFIRALLRAGSGNASRAVPAGHVSALHEQPPRSGQDGARSAYPCLPLLWLLALVCLYAWRLPVTYQHARYLMPAIPIVAIYGLAGTLAWLRPRLRPRAGPGAAAFAARAGVALLLGVPLAFTVLGARAYAADVRVINREMVAAARWVAANTPPDALIAAHDVGALGYFARRPLVDLAGLVSPDAIPYLGDPDATAAYVRRRGAGYLVQGAGFSYPALTAAPGANLVFRGEEVLYTRMEVFQLR